MKNIKFLVLLIIMAVMFMGVGYASWKDSLTINSVIQTGVMAVNFVEDTESKLESTVAGEYVKVNVKIDEKNNNTAEVAIDNLYPGAWAAFRLKAVNSGTIPAKFDNVVVEFDKEVDEKGNELPEKDKVLPYLTYKTGLRVYGQGQKEGFKDINLQGNLQDIGLQFNDKLQEIKDIQLEPNGVGSIYLGTHKLKNLKDPFKEGYMFIYYSKDAPNSTQGRTLTFKIKFNFKQFNK